MENYERLVKPRVDGPSLIPDGWKPDIDQMLIDDYMEANRYFAENDSLISDAISNVIRFEPELFYRELLDTWQFHHNFFEGPIYDGLKKLMQSQSASLNEWVDFMLDGYEASAKVDMLTLIYSAAIKKHIELHINAIAAKYDIVPQSILERFLNVRSFFVYYDVKNAPIALSEGQNIVIPEDILNEFHARDITIGESRLAKLKEKYDFMDIEEVVEMLDKPINNEDKPDWMEGSDWDKICSLRKTLQFDNLEEYMIAYNLEGFAGYLLRKHIIALLTERGILDERNGIYAYSDDEIMKGLKSMKKPEEGFPIKRQYGLTCSAACAAMIEALYLGSDLNDNLENKYDIKATSKYMDGQHYSKIAAALAEVGLNVRLVHEQASRFKQGNLPNNLFDLLMREYEEGLRECKQYGVPEESGVTIDISLLKEQLLKGHKIMLAGKLRNGIYHSVLLIDFKDGMFEVVDPLTGQRTEWSLGKIAEFSDTDIGKWCIIIYGARSDQETNKKLIKEYGKSALNKINMLQ